MKEIEESFSVKIDDRNGRWTTTALVGIRRGMDKLQGKIGEDGFQKLFGGVKFSVDAVADSGMETTGNRDIKLGKDLMNGKSHIGYIERETVHELAHIWDDSCNDCMSKGMMKETGSFYARGRYYAVGKPPTDYAKEGRGEDWAESVVSALYPGYASNRNWDQNRRNWVKNKLNEIKNYPEESRYR